MYLLSIALLVVGVCYFTATGYDYLGLACIFFGLLVLFFALCRHLSFKHPKPIRILRAAVTVVFIIGFSYYSIIQAFIIHDAVKSDSQDADCIIVLGANVLGSSPSPALTDRLECALDYLETHSDCIAILCGGNETGQSLTEAECMRDWLAERNIATERLILENRSTSTYENIQFARDIVTDEQSIAILTSEYHMHRALYLACALGLSPDRVCAGTSSLPEMLNGYIREVFGMTYYYVFGVN